jgi:general stress protein 26
MDKNENSDLQKLGELIKGIRIAMLTTVDDEGCLHSRPMANQDDGFDGTLWFFTDANSAKVHELARDRHVNLSYSDPGENRYVSVSGTASVSRDRAKMKELWSPLHKAWFPDGLEDPNIALLRVEVDKAEYWDSPSSAVVRLYGFAKALATGKPYGEEGADHEKIRL